MLAAAGVDVPRQALQALALEELRAGGITEVYQEYNPGDFEQEQKALRELGI